jgi:hypothetical protein
LGVVVLIVLAAVWAAFLLPPILRARAEHRPSGSISDFRRQLRVLARTSPSGPVASTLRTTPRPALTAVRPGTLGMAPQPAVRLGRSRRTVKRRRDVFVALLVAMGGSLVLGALPQLRVLWAVHVVCDLLFAGYVAALVYLRNLAAEREMKVRFLPTAPPEPALLYRRSAN